MNQPTGKSPEARPTAEGARMEMTLHERERDGSLYINQGSPERGFHQRFDIHCDQKTAEEMIAGYNQLPAIRSAAEKALALADTVDAYLSYSSIDGRVERRPLRIKLKQQATDLRTALNGQTTT